MTTTLEAMKPLIATTESEELDRFMQRFEQRLAQIADGQKGFLSQLVDYVLTGSGKRVRPALVFLCSRWGNPAEEDVERVALAVELTHIATLIHDDLVDEAVLRRKKPTVTVKFGEGAAVLLGDHVYAQAFAQLAALGDMEFVRLFSEATLLMCEGEIAQLESRYDFSLDEQTYMTFLDRKTASLMAACCRAGARLGGLSLTHQEALESFGRNLGLAFQIVDDLLDLEGDEAVTGKTLRTDVHHGKMTLPLIHYRAQLEKKEERSSFQTMLLNLNGDFPLMVRRMQEAGSMSYARARAGEILAQADSALNSLPDCPSRRLLASLSQRLSDRRV